MADIYSLLKEKNDKLFREYDTARSDISTLLDTLHHHVLHQLALELALPDSDFVWLSEWLSDIASMFRLLKRHKFACPSTLQEIRAISIWRVRVLRPILLLPIPTLLHCLPPPIADPLGRPMVFLKLASLQSFSCSVKDVLLQEVERLRLHLRYLRDYCAHTGSSPLQFVVLVDLESISIQNYDLDLCSWLVTEIIPRYPGMLAAVFLLNYSWIHSSAWSVAKRVLPSSTIARVFFPSKAQLLNYCSAATLPAEYGGSLPTLDQIDNVLCSAYQTQHLPPPPPPSLSDGPIASSTSTRLVGENPILPSSATSTAFSASAPQRRPSTIALPPFSPRNPFFGYPVIASASSPHSVRHVRRGLRELLYTLAVLWWRRWGRWAWRCVGMCGVAFMVVQRMRCTKERVRIKTIQEMVKAIIGIERVHMTTT